MNYLEVISQAGKIFNFFRYLSVSVLGEVLQEHVQYSVVHSVASGNFPLHITLKLFSEIVAERGKKQLSFTYLVLQCFLPSSAYYYHLCKI